MPQRSAISAKPKPPAARAAVPTARGRSRLPSASGRPGHKPLGLSPVAWGVLGVCVAGNRRSCAQRATGSASPACHR